MEANSLIGLPPSQSDGNEVDFRNKNKMRLEEFFERSGLYI
jgi:hypothetical protein